MSSSQSLRPSAALGAKFDDKPLWNHVKVVATADGGGGNRTWNCNYCNKKVFGSYTKVKGHLMRLAHHNVEGKEWPQVTVEAKKAQQALNARRKADYVSIPEERDVADKEATRMFYASGLPFNFARSPYFRKYSLTLANSRLAGYVPPSFDRLRTTLLAQEKVHINRQRRPLINVMAASSGRAMFVKAIDASGNVKDAEYVASLFIQVIKDLGEANVVQIVTDNALNYKAAGLSIEGKYPHIFWTPCVVHSLNLALKSICEPGETSLQYAQCKWVSDLVKQVIGIHNFILNHGMANHIFNRYSSLKLLSVAETRFASSFIMAKRLREVKSSLEVMVMDSNWKTYREDGNTVAETKAREPPSPSFSLTIVASFSLTIAATEPLILSHHRSHREQRRSTQQLSSHSSQLRRSAILPLENRVSVAFPTEKRGFAFLGEERQPCTRFLQLSVGQWNKSNTPLHCMAHSLVPKYYCDAWLNDGGGNGVTWVAPHEDHEVSINRSGDQFDIEGQEVGELAQLSLDEPELERMTFQDAEEGEGTDIGTG
ncbi:hypothetical protein Acr_04g0004140 [Actinidia rufa]|uniref:DUF659 domain-containing protein n=1 Tax=Actinidia rufa TaxID=165716 RepID=A0A7J0EHK9_9ERIC|nr:hypothetical protein Acr_04g0004140 [Actinidia rufa]